jgi:hypothetical protein
MVPLTASAIDGIANDLRPSIVMAVPSRITWRGLRFPRRAVLSTAVAIRGGFGSTAVLFRIGISDDRSYEELARQVIRADSPHWTTISADLSRYAGWQWSLFYHPDRRCWNLIFNVSAEHGGSPALVALWAGPAVYTDIEAQRAFANRAADRCP